MLEVGYDSHMASFGETIRTAREEAGLTQRAVAEHFGIHRVSVTQWESDTTKPEIGKIAELAKLYRTSTDRLLAVYGAEEPPRPRTKGQPIRYVPGEEVVIPGRAKLLPVYSGAMGGSGKLIVSSDFVDHVAMPAALSGVSGAYGLMVDGESMVPEYWPGDIAWINPHLKQARGRNHVFFHTPPGGEEAEAIIKRLNGWNDRDWDLEQWNPAKHFKESRKIWPICHRVVGKYDAS